LKNTIDSNRFLEFEKRFACSLVSSRHKYNEESGSVKRAQAQAFLVFMLYCGVMFIADLVSFSESWELSSSVTLIILFIKSTFTTPTSSPEELLMPILVCKQV